MLVVNAVVEKQPSVWCPQWRGTRTHAVAVPFSATNPQQRPQVVPPAQVPGNSEVNVRKDAMRQIVLASYPRRKQCAVLVILPRKRESNPLKIAKILRNCNGNTHSPRYVFVPMRLLDGRAR